MLSTSLYLHYTHIQKATPHVLPVVMAGHQIIVIVHGDLKKTTSWTICF